MRFVSIEDARPGMCLAYDLYDSMGRTMVGSGCELTASYINKLNEYGFSGIYIEDEQSKDIYIEATIPEKLRQEGFKCVQENDIDRCAEIAQQIVENLLSRKNVCLDMTDLRSYDDYTYAHSVNVAVLCCVIGMGMGMSERDLNYLVTAALLHEDVLMSAHHTHPPHVQFLRRVTVHLPSAPVGIRFHLHFHDEEVPSA